MFSRKANSADTGKFTDKSATKRMFFINLVRGCVKVKKLITINLYQKKRYKVIVRVKNLAQTIAKKDKLCYN